MNVLLPSSGQKTEATCSSQNFAKHLPDYTASHPRRLVFIDVVVRISKLKEIKKKFQ
jgi:hypothetical protein